MKERPAWQRVLYQIWPKIYRVINGAVFFVVQILREGARIAIKQFKQ